MIYITFIAVHHVLSTFFFIESIDKTTRVGQYILLETALSNSKLFTCD